MKNKIIETDRIDTKVCKIRVCDGVDITVVQHDFEDPAFEVTLDDDVEQRLFELAKKQWGKNDAH